MRISVTNFWLIVFLLTAFGCGKKMDTASSESSSDEWPEMDSFHMIMAEAFHPYKDSSNVEPAKMMAEEMAQAAAAWQSVPLPEKVNNDEVKAQLGQLATDARKLADQIKARIDDAEIGKSLTSLHDTFHKITEAWHGSGEKHEH